MRYLLGLLCVCALGIMQVVGCSDECQNAEDCDDGNVCTDDECRYTGRCDYFPVRDGRGCDFDDIQGVCVSGICEESPCAGDPCDDDNVCTGDFCDYPDGSCRHNDAHNGGSCDWDGVLGICVDGVCGEDLCKGVVCDDDNECTYDNGCNFRDGSCSYTNRDSGTSWRVQYCDWDGVSGICVDGVCREDPCNGVVCEDEDLCTNDLCRPTEGECTDDTCAWNGTCFFRGVHCSDGNICTDGICDPETGECYHIPVDGGFCCAGIWGREYCSSCLNPSGCSCCSDSGRCQDGRCVAN